jgi:hypothetical protein
VLLEQIKWEIFELLPYSPELAPNDYHLFLHLKKLLAGQELGSDQQAKDVTVKWVEGLMTTIFDKGIQKLFPCCKIYF